MRPNDEILDPRASAAGQVDALEAAPDIGNSTQPAVDTGGYTGERKDESTVGEKDWDPAWERRMNKMFPEEKGNMWDPGFRAKLNRMARKKRNANQAAKPPEASSTPTGGVDPPPTGGVDPPPGNGGGSIPQTLPPAATNNNVQPRVLAGGRLPGGEPIFQTLAGPWGSGWIPAGRGLWWPPWPTTAGPIERPDATMPMTLTALGQAGGLEK